MFENNYDTGCSIS